MNKWSSSLDFTIASSIDTDFVNFIRKVFGTDIYFFDSDAFRRINKYEACISSNLVVALSSSYDDEVIYNNVLYRVYIHNGTLQNVVDKNYRPVYNISDFCKKYKIAINKL